MYVVTSGVGFIVSWVVEALKDKSIEDIIILKRISESWEIFDATRSLQLGTESFE